MKSCLLLGVIGCTHAAMPSRPPRCFPLYPLAANARWTYDVTIVAGEGDASTTRHVRVVRSVGEMTPDGRTRLDTAPAPEDSGVEATERYRVTPDRIYDGDNTVDENLRLVATPEKSLAWGGPRWFYAPGDGQWKFVGRVDAAPYHDCVKVLSNTKYGETTQVYCAGVGPVVSEYRESVPRSHDDPALGHHRDATWQLRELVPGKCAR
ncbi:MAG: hypothetical protein ABJE66_19560 [Deltaproteobacteria bacterium]